MSAHTQRAIGAILCIHQSLQGRSATGAVTCPQATLPPIVIMHPSSVDGVLLHLLRVPEMKAHIRSASDRRSLSEHVCKPSDVAEHYTPQNEDDAVATQKQLADEPTRNYHCLQTPAAVDVHDTIDERACFVASLSFEQQNLALQLPVFVDRLLAFFALASLRHLHRVCV